MTYWTPGKKLNFRDWELWELYTNCFENWTENDFNRVDSITKSTLRKYLIEHGVFMTRVQDKGKGNIAKQLMQPLETDAYHVWTPEEYDSWANLKSGARFNIDSIFNTENSDHSESKLKGKGKSKNTKEDIKYQDMGKSEEISDNEIDNVIEKLPIQNPRQDYTSKDSPQPKNKQLESLVSLYKETDKYKDGTDSFDYKLIIFLDNCNNACVEPKNYANALTNMFAMPAREVYLDGTLNKFSMSFEERCKMIKDHYETEPWRIRRENIWNGMELNLLKRQHPDWILSETFEWLNSEARRVQRGLPNHQGDFALRQRIISACYAYTELRPVIFEPPPDIEGVCNKIRAQLAQLEFTSSRDSFIQDFSNPFSIHINVQKA